VSASAVCTNEYLLASDPTGVDLRSTTTVALPSGAAISLGENFANAQPGDASPGVVLRPHWFKHDIGQSTPYPSCINVITVTLAVSTPIVADCPIPFKIEIGNLYDQSRAEASASGSLARLNTMTAPEPRTGSLVLNPQHCKVCDAEDDHMAFQNASSNGTQGSGHWLSGYVEAVQVLNHSSGYGEGRLEIQGYGGQGFAARYCVCSANGVKLNSGATIGAGNIMCKITISNAGYDYTSGGAIQVIPDEATQMDHAPSLFFTINRKLVLYPSASYTGLWTANRTYTFSFEITNPNVAQESPDVTVSATGLCTRHMRRDMEAPCCASCTTEGVAMAGHAAPLKIIEPLFCAKTIAQSTDFPCQTNTLCVTLSANFPLVR